MKLNRSLAISDNGFIFNPNTGDSFSVNDLGLSILQKIREGISKKDIVAALCAEYNAEKSVIEKDMDEFLKVIRTHQLVEFND
jgi:hypothetical protein